MGGGVDMLGANHNSREPHLSVSVARTMKTKPRVPLPSRLPRGNHQHVNPCKNKNATPPRQNAV
eukprot:12403709-Karenia_brevis.AAC.1